MQQSTPLTDSDFLKLRAFSATLNDQKLETLSKDASQERLSDQLDWGGYMSSVFNKDPNIVLLPLYARSEETRLC